MNAYIKNDFSSVPQVQLRFRGVGADWAKDMGPHHLEAQSQNIYITHPLPH